MEIEKFDTLGIHKKATAINYILELKEVKKPNNKIRFHTIIAANK